MKLKNKKTGEILEFDAILPVKDVLGDSVAHLEYDSLAKLNEEWEDVSEGPKWYWYINCFGKVLNTLYNGDEWDEQRKLIGNYFLSKEEAEKAVEKLKAINILKDNGFRFIQWEFDPITIADGKIWFDVGVNTQWDAEQLLEYRPEVKESLDLLFGGER